MKIRKLVLVVIISLAVLAVVANLVRVAIIYISMEQGKNAYEYNYCLDAITKYTQAIKFILWDKKKKADVFLWRSRAYLQGSYFDQSIADLSKAIELCPDDYTYYLWRGRVYQQIENYDLAITDCKEAIRLNRDDSSGIIYKDLGDIYYRKGEYELAISNYETSLQINPDLADAKKELERAKESLEIHKRAEQINRERKAELEQRYARYTEAIRLNPQNANAYFKRGYACFLNTIGDLAVDDLTEKDIFFLTVKIFLRGGFDELDMAISDFEATLKINPNHADAKKYLERARQIRGN